MSETYMTTDNDALTGESVTREMTPDEIESYLETIAEIEKQDLQALAAKNAREASIRKMAEASGLTEPEIEALF